METEIIYDSINVTEISRYFAAAMDESAVLEHSLHDYTMSRKYKRGSRPTVRAREMESEWKESESSWVRALLIKSLSKENM